MKNNNTKLVRITTVPMSLDLLLSGQLNFMTSYYKVLAVSSEVDYLKKIGIKEKVQTQPVVMSRKIEPLQDAIALLKLYWLFKRENPKIVHSHTPKAGILAMLASKLAGVPIRLHTVAGLPLMEEKGFKRMLLERVEKLTYTCANTVYPNSKGLYDFILENKFTTANKLKIIGNGSSNGIDTNYFSIDKISQNELEGLKLKLGIETSDFVYVFVGRLVGDKGINEVVVAFKTIIEQNHKVKLLLVGLEEKDLDPLDDATTKEIKSNGNILFVGYQSDVRPYMAISKALIFASYREGFPNVVLQAGAMGLPSIVTNINGCNEIIEDGKNGILIPVKNSQAIEKAVLKMTTDIDFFNTLQSNARPMITARFEQKEIWQAILSEYKHHEMQISSQQERNVYGDYVKPFLDFCFAFFALILLSPLFFIAVLVLFFANDGSVFFLQKRPGLAGKLFTIIKFKTMNDTKDDEGNLLPDHKRLTRMGKWIRNASIDELPQLLNVIKGEMSLVGPRPLLPEYLNLYTEDQKKRHNLKPGITGWAQINGRNAIDWDTKLEYDLWYIENQSFNLDLRIIFITLQKVIKVENINVSKNTMIAPSYGRK